MEIKTRFHPRGKLELDGAYLWRGWPKGGNILHHAVSPRRISSDVTKLSEKQQIW